MKQLAGLGSLGLLVGTAAGVLVPLPERAPKAEEVALLTPAANRPSVREVPAPCPDLRAEQQAELDEAWSNLEAAEASKLDLESELAEFIGEPPSFEDYPPEFQPDAIEDAVFDMLDPEVAELEWVDCAEAPCIAILRLVGPAVRFGSTPALSLSENVRHSEDSSTTRDSSTRPHSVHTRSPCWWSSIIAVGLAQLRHIWLNLAASCCAGLGAVAMTAAARRRWWSPWPPSARSVAPSRADGGNFRHAFFLPSKTVLDERVPILNVGPANHPYRISVT